MKSIQKYYIKTEKNKQNFLMDFVDKLKIIRYNIIVSRVENCLEQLNLDGML